MLYSPRTGVAPGIEKTIQAILLQLATPLAGRHFLRRDPKVIIARYYGDPCLAGDFDPCRGDGSIFVLSPDTIGYAEPNGVFLHGRSNILAGVPMWLLAPVDKGLPHGATLAVGCYHPRWDSATLDLFCPASRQFLCRAYFGHPDPNHHETSIADQKEHIAESDGRPGRSAGMAPVHPDLEAVFEEL